jgi:hypothetical protein
VEKVNLETNQRTVRLVETRLNQKFEGEIIRVAVKIETAGS